MVKKTKQNYPPFQLISQVVEGGLEVIKANNQQFFCDSTLIIDQKRKKGYFLLLDKEIGPNIKRFIEQ